MWTAHQPSGEEVVVLILQLKWAEAPGHDMEEPGHQLGPGCGWSKASLLCLAALKLQLHAEATKSSLSTTLRSLMEAKPVSSLDQNQSHARRQRVCQLSQCTLLNTHRLCSNISCAGWRLRSKGHTLAHVGGSYQCPQDLPAPRANQLVCCAVWRRHLEGLTSWMM